MKESNDDHRPKTVTIFVGFFFLVNFILGAGFLGIPFSFFHGGILVGSCSLIAVTFLAFITATYVLETMSRAQAIIDLKKNNRSSFIDRKPNFLIKDTRKFEISELCDMFIGKWFKFSFIVCLLVHGILTLIVYVGVASSAWAVNIPFNFDKFRECEDLDFLHQYFPLDQACSNTYRVCVTIFTTIAIPLSLLDLKEQALIQFAFGILRFLMLTLIIVYCLFYLLAGETLPIEEEDSFYNITNFTLMSHTEAVFHFDFTGWVIGIPVIYYAIMLHQGIPSLVHPIREKHLLKWCFMVVFATVGSFYLVTSIVGALWYRNIVNETFTLNWNPYTERGHTLPIRIFSYLVILFPSIDICSVYPLVVHALVNNVYVLIFSRDVTQDKHLYKSILLQLLLKFAVAFMPIVFAMFVSNLVFVVKYAGLAGFLIGTFFPIVIHIRSQWVCRHKFSLMYSNNFSKHSIPLKNGTGATSDDDNTKVDGIENEPLITEDEHNDELYRFDCREFGRFLFSWQDTKLYSTPYSTFCSHPVCVIFVSIGSVLVYALMCVSLFIHPISIR